MGDYSAFVEARKTLVQAFRCAGCYLSHKKALRVCTSCGLHGRYLPAEVPEAILAADMAGSPNRPTGFFEAPGEEPGRGPPGGFSGSRGGFRPGGFRTGGDDEQEGSERLGGRFLPHPSEEGEEGEEGNEGDEGVDEEDEGGEKISLDDEDDDTTVEALYEGEAVQHTRLSTGDESLDRTLGGGGVPVGNVVGIAAQPGAGKSTLLRQVGAAMANGVTLHSPAGVRGKSRQQKPLRVLIACPEESKNSLRVTRDRLRLPERYPRAGKNLFITCAAKVENVLKLAHRKKVDVLIFDSIDYAESALYQKNLKIEATKLLCRRAHSTEEFEGLRPLTTFLVYHATKAGKVMGSNSIIHAVDTFLWNAHIDPDTGLDVDNQDEPTGFIVCRAHKKNRSGRVPAQHFYQFADDGLEAYEGVEARPASKKPASKKPAGKKLATEKPTSTTGKSKKPVSKKPVKKPAKR